MRLLKAEARLLLPPSLETTKGASDNQIFSSNLHSFIYNGSFIYNNRSHPATDHVRMACTSSQFLEHRHACHRRSSNRSLCKLHVDPESFRRRYPLVSTFLIHQSHLVNLSRLFPFGITVGALTLLFVIYGGALQANPSTQLEPASIIIISIILFGLYVTGAVETAIQLFGSGSNVNSNCQNYVLGTPSYGASVNTLAWLEQQSICTYCQSLSQHTTNGD